MKTEYTISYTNIETNSDRILFYSIFNVIFFIPSAYAFNIWYNIVQFVYDIKSIGIKNYFKKNYFIFLLIPLFIIVFFTRKYILNFFNIYGLVYISILICSKIVNHLFFLLRFKYESYIAIYEHILLNIFINSEVIQKVLNKKLILKPEYIIIFNMFGFLLNKFYKFRGLEKLVTGFDTDSSIKNISITTYENRHITKKYLSEKYLDKNLTNNLTSQSSIKVIDEKNCQKLYRNDFYSEPNAVGQDKPNAFTPTYESDIDSIIIQKLPRKMIIDENKFTINSLNSLVSHRHDPILYNKGGKFYEVQGSPTVSEYSKEFEINAYHKFILIDEFEKENQEYLNTPEGAFEYTMLKLCLFSKIFYPFKIY